MGERRFEIRRAQFSLPRREAPRVARSPDHQVGISPDLWDQRQQDKSKHDFQGKPMGRVELRGVALSIDREEVEDRE